MIAHCLLKKRISDIRGIKKDQFPKEQKLMFLPLFVSAEIPAAADMLKIS